MQGMQPGMPQQGMSGFPQQQVCRCLRIKFIATLLLHAHFKFCVRDVHAHLFRRVSATLVDFNETANIASLRSSPSSKITPRNARCETAAVVSHTIFFPE